MAEEGFSSARLMCTDVLLKRENIFLRIGRYGMKKRQKRRIANAVMVAIILAVIAAGIAFVGNLRGWWG